jgi:hypothetical protein
MTVSLTTLFTVETLDSLLATGLSVAAALGLPVTSWRVDDPTRALFSALAEYLAEREALQGFFIRSGFLSWATGDWLRVLASEVYGVDVPDAAPASTTVDLLNSGAGWYDLGVGEFRVRSTSSGVTYTSTEALSLHGAGATQTLDVVADVDGSEGSAALDEIDAFETILLGVTITGSAAAIGVDVPSDEETREQCRATRGALSPNGPADAYEYVARNATLTGAASVTRAHATEDAPNLVVTVYVATASGAPSGADVTLVQSALDVWATPLTATATAVAASEVAQAITATVTGGDVPADVEALAEAALGAMFAALPIGPCTLARSAVYAAIHGVLVTAGVTNPVVALSVPATDVTLTAGQVATLGTVTVTEV